MPVAPEAPRDSGHVGTGDRLDFGPLANRLGYTPRRAQIVVLRNFCEAFQPFEIKPAQYSILTVIERNPGRKQSQVCEALGSSAPIWSP